MKRLFVVPRVVLRLVPRVVLFVVLPWLLAGCPSPSSKRIARPALGAPSEGEATRLAHLFAELQDDILASYERDEPFDFDTGMIDPSVGTARIGAGPEDVYIAGRGGRGGRAGAGDHPIAPSRWPLDIDGGTRRYVRSKRLEIQIAADRSAAWMADELSWRIEVCGRTAVIPLRITALYAHDGDRWVPVFEHLSFGFPPTPVDAPRPKAIGTQVVSGDLRDKLWGVLAHGLFRAAHDPLVVAQDPSALVLGPNAGDEWHGAQVVLPEVRLPAGRFEDRRVGTVGRTPRGATVAYWVGNYIADIPARPGSAAGKVRMRVTHVFEKRRPSARDREASEAESCAPLDRDGGEKDEDKNANCQWMLVQTHMSQPISDDELAQQVFGRALISPKPLQLDCADGWGPPCGEVPPRGPDHGS